MMLSVILAVLAAGAAHIAPETRSANQCLDLLRDAGRAVNVVDADTCVKRIVRSVDKESHAELVDLALTWARYLDTSVRPPEDLTSDSQAADRLYRLNAVIAHGLQSLSSDHDLAPEVLELLTRIITKTWCSLQMQHQCMQLLGQADFPEKLRRNAVLEIIQHRRNSTVAPRALLDVIDPSYFPRLVELVSSSDAPETFHFGAASVLAHFGYQGVLARFNSLRPSFLAKHQNIEGYLIYYIWQIEIQNPPEKLLTFIRSKPGPRIEKRLWATTRAVKLGVPSEKIRDAILAYASQVQRNKHGIRPGLSSIKSVGLTVGVLRTDDLPDVRIIKTKPNH